MFTSNHFDDFDDERYEDHPEGSSDTTDLYPYFLNAIETRQQTKLERLLKTAYLNQPKDPYSKALASGMKVHNLNDLTPSHAYIPPVKPQNQANKDTLESGDLILDPLRYNGLVNLLHSMERQIAGLGFLRSKSKGAASLALIKTKLRMRRKSDVSQWSGGVSQLEQATSFLDYQYLPAIAVFDSDIKKDSTSPMLKSVVDTMMSLRHRNQETNLISERRSQASLGISSSTMTIVAQGMNLKTCLVKESKVLAIEDDISAKKGHAHIAESMKNLLKMLGLGANPGLKTRVIIVNIDKLKDLPDPASTTYTPLRTNGIPSQREVTSRSDANRKLSEPMSYKGIELALPKKDRRKFKNHTAIEPSIHSRFNVPSLEAIECLHPDFSQDGIIHHAGEKREGSKPAKNVRIQTLTKKKLATIVANGKTKKAKDEAGYAKPLENKPKQARNPSICSPVTEPGHEIVDKKYSHSKMLLTVQSQKTSPVGSRLDLNNSSSIKLTYNSNIKHIITVMKPRKPRQIGVEELKTLDRTKVLSKTYACGLISPKLSPKRIIVL